MLPTGVYYLTGTARIPYVVLVNLDLPIPQHNLATVFLLSGCGKYLSHSIAGRLNSIRRRRDAPQLSRHVSHVGLHPARVDDKGVKPLVLAVQPDAVPRHHSFGGAIDRVRHGRLSAVGSFDSSQRLKQSQCNVDLSLPQSASARPHNGEDGLRRRLLKQGPHGLIQRDGAEHVDFDVLEDALARHLFHERVGLGDAGIGDDDIHVVDAMGLSQFLGAVKGALPNACIILDYDQFAAGCLGQLLKCCCCRVGRVTHCSDYGLGIASDLLSHYVTHNACIFSSSAPDRYGWDSRGLAGQGISGQGLRPDHGSHQ